MVGDSNHGIRWTTTPSSRLKCAEAHTGSTGRFIAWLGQGQWHMSHEAGRAQGPLDFMRSRFEEPAGEVAVTSKKWLRRGMPVVILILILTAPYSPLALVSRAIVVGVLLAELLRIGGYFPVLNLWVFRIVELVLACIAIGLSLHAYTSGLMLILPMVVALVFLYIWHKYSNWKLRQE